VISFLIIPQGAWAHALDTGYLSLVECPDRLELVLTVDAERSANEFGLDQGPIGTLSRLAAYARSRVEVQLDSSPSPIIWADPAIGSENFSKLFQEERMYEEELLRDEGRPLYLHLTGSVLLKKKPRTLTISADFSDRFGENHIFLIKLAQDDQVQTAVLNRDSRKTTLLLREERSLWEQDLQFVKLGTRHILLGVDHLLFLLALLVIGGRASSLIKIITSFTVAHSLTLTLAVLGWVDLPSRLVESAIALSIVYVGLENFFVHSVSHRWILTFFFGLAHGFGFAGALKELGLPRRGLMGALLSFNVGVEAGQLAVVACLLPLIWILARNRFRLPAIRAVSAFVAICGMVWFLERSLSLEPLF